MGVLTNTLFEARVDFYNVFGPDGTRPRAAVRHEQPPTLPDGANALATLIPLTAARLLYNSQAQPEITDQMMGMLRDCSGDMLEGEPKARAFSFVAGYDYIFDRESGAVTPGPDVTLESLALLHELPGLDPGATGTPDQSFTMELRRNRRRGGPLWAKVKAPVRGPAFYAAYGLFALIEHTGRAAPYEAIVVPAMTAVGFIADFYFDVMEREGWEGGDTLRMLSTCVAEIARDDDPGEAAESILESLEVVP